MCMVSPDRSSELLDPASSDTPPPLLYVGTNPPIPPPKFFGVGTEKTVNISIKVSPTSRKRNQLTIVIGLAFSIVDYNAHRSRLIETKTSAFLYIVRQPPELPVVSSQPHHCQAVTNIEVYSYSPMSTKAMTCDHL